MKKKKLDVFHYHEMLHMAYMESITIDVMLNHPVAEKHKKIRKQLSKIHNALAKVYSLAGSMEVKKFP